MPCRAGRLATSSNLIFANCSLCRPPPTTTTNPLAAAGPSTGSFSLFFTFFANLHSTRRHAALLPREGLQELGVRHPVGRDTHSVPQSCSSHLPAPADPPGARHLQPDPRQHREAMGRHAPSGAGRPVDVAEGSHEGGLEGDDYAGEEGWCVHPIRARCDAAGRYMTYPCFRRGTREGPRDRREAITKR
jgi:hypothetical protein